MSLNWKSTAMSVSWNIGPFVNGRYSKSRACDYYDNVEPSTETILCKVSVGDAADVDEAVRVARCRFDDGCWSELSPMRRRDILRKLADLIVAHKSEFALLDTLEMGKPISASLYDCGHFAPRLLRSSADFCDKLVGSIAPLGGVTMLLNTYEPRGVVGAITPWNFPLVCAVLKVGPALAAGNTVVLKPSEVSPSSALRLAELALEAGVPEGVLNVVPGLGSTVGTALASHSDVNLLSFTGSTATGRKIIELSGRSNGKPLLIECGGKSPQIVFDDIGDLDFVADAAVQSVLWNQGQVCGAHSRLIVHENIKEALLDRVIARAEKYQPGDPLKDDTEFGPLANRAQCDRVKKYIEDGLSAGANAVLLGNVNDSGGCYVSPTIFDEVTGSMAIVREEIFGPVLCVQSFKRDEEALALANSTEYGLAATVWTRDIGRGKRLAHAIRSGYVSIRTSGVEAEESGCVLGSEPQGSSGFGTEMGIQGLQSYSNLKAVCFNGA